MRIVLIGLAGLGAVAVGLVGFWVYATQTVEVAPYKLVRKDGPVEIRDYPPQVVAEIDRRGGRDAAVRAGFRPLAGYIFASERPGPKIAMTAPVTQTPRQKIAMTAPVTQTPSGADDWAVRFVMPSKYRLTDLPTPANPDVHLHEIPARRVAAIRFSGVANDALLAREEALLRDWMAAHAVTAEGPATFAYYNDPFTPGFLRRNEVLIPASGG